MNSATRTLPIDCLRTFVAIADRGTFAGAAERVGRTVSAVSLQVDRLEGQTKQALFERDGRRMKLTAAGRLLLDHARTILAANDAALTALSADKLSGTVRLGVLHDAMEEAVATVLADFALAHPEAKIEVQVDTSRALVDELEAEKLDQAIAFRVDTRLPSEVLGPVPMVWIGAARRAISIEPGAPPLPLILLDEPCAFRRAALSALDGAGIPWRIVMTSASLAAVRAAVLAGLGVTARTVHFASSLGAGCTILDHLPALPEKQLLLYRRVPEITSRTGRALHTACLERISQRVPSTKRQRGR